MKNSINIDDSTISILMHQLNSNSNSIAVNAARSLGILGFHATKAIPQLIVASIAKNIELRGQACASVGRIATNPIIAVPALANALKDEQTSVRRYAAAALVEYGSEVNTVVDQLITSLDDPDDYVREFIISSVKNLECTLLEVKQSIKERQYDGNYFVRTAAKRILKRCDIDSKVA